jgi:hypothetical protein
MECKRIPLAAFDDNFRVAPGSSSITANDLEVGLEAIGEDQARYMTGFDRVRDGHGLEDAARFIGLMRPWRQAWPHWDYTEHRCQNAVGRKE